MSEIGIEYKKIMEEIENAISNEKEKQFVKTKMAELSISFVDIIDRITKAEPFPGFTCWNSTTLNTFPSISNVVPFLKSPAEYTVAILFTPFKFYYFIYSF